MYTLQTETLKFALDEKGFLKTLCNLTNSRDYAGSGGLWRLIYSCGQELERMASAETNTPKISVDGSTMKIDYAKLTGELGESLDIELKLTVQAVGDELKFSAEIINNASGIEVRELHFPLVMNCNITSGQRLIWSASSGERRKNVEQFIRSAHSRYIGKDNFEVRRSVLYPGFAATNSFVLENDDEGLYFASYDPTFQFTLHLLGADDSGINPAMVKYPFIKEGRSWKADNYIISPYQGTWHVAARKYRNWAGSWFKNRKPMADIVNMNGWQRIIMRHQYGEVHYRYDQMEELCRDGLAAGIDTLFMFGWHQGGHDSEYPEYIADESMGGMPALKENIRKFHDAGGKLILYFNGQLIDMNTKYYDEIGHRISVKKANGREHLEVYPFGGNGTALREFGNKTFVTACPACKEWWDTLKKCIDTAIELDADGVFFDQLGWISRPCFDPSHGHPVPLMNPLKYKAEMLEELQKYTKAKRPDMSLGIEWVSDVTAQHVDYIHSINGGTTVWNDWENTGEPPEYIGFMDWFMYIFPNVRMTDREIRDDTDIERRVNHALVKGLRSDVEIYRCRRSIAETPHYSEYLKGANRLRDKYRDLILNGEFHDDDYFEADTDGLTAACFRNGDNIAVIVTQSHRDSMTFKLDIPGFKLIDTDGLNDWKVTPENDSSYKVELPRHGLALLHLNTVNMELEVGGDGLSCIEDVSSLKDFKSLPNEYRIYYIGDSITRHRFNRYTIEELKWGYVAGMAASSAAKDYAHLLADSISSTMPGRPVRMFFGKGVNVPGAMDGLAEAADYAPHLVIVQLGEHAKQYDGTEQAEIEYRELLESLLKLPSKPLILATGVWAAQTGKKEYSGWAAEIEHIQKKVCAELEVPFASVEKYALDSKCSGFGEVAGVKWHPNDKGMQGYADELFRLFQKNADI